MALSIQDRTVLITGASSGIGAACAHGFAQQQTRLILAARRQDRLESLAHKLTQTYNSAVYPLVLDVRDRHLVQTQLQGLPTAWADVDILINNAGLARGSDKVQMGDWQDWEEMLETNVKGLLAVTREVVPGMLARGRGHVINIGSLASRQTYPGGSVYCASKAAVRAISEGLKIDLLGTPIRVSEVQPGLVETEFSEVRFHGNQVKAKAVYQNLTPLMAEDIADTVVFCATRPPHVNISELLVVSTDQATPTLVHRH